MTELLHVEQPAQLGILLFLLAALGSHDPPYTSIEVQHAAIKAQGAARRSSILVALVTRASGGAWGARTCASVAADGAGPV